MNKLIIIMTCLLCAGCSDIHKHEVDKLIAACKDHGGLDRIETYMYLSSHCEDGTFVLRPFDD